LTVYTSLLLSIYHNGIIDKDEESSSWRGKELFSETSRPALWPTQPPIQWVLEALFPEVKHPRHEAENLPLSSAKVKNQWAVPPFSHKTS